MGGECCMMCDRGGKLVPSGECSNPMLGEKPCPILHCEEPITVMPPIIIDPPGRKSIVIFFKVNSHI